MATRATSALSCFGVPQQYASRKESAPTAELVLKSAAEDAAFGRHLAELATLHRGLLIRGSVVRSQLAEPLPALSRTSASARLTRRRSLVSLASPDFALKSAQLAASCPAARLLCLFAHVPGHRRRRGSVLRWHRSTPI